MFTKEIQSTPISNEEIRTRVIKVPNGPELVIDTYEEKIPEKFFLNESVSPDGNFYSVFCQSTWDKNCYSLWIFDGESLIYTDYLVEKDGLEETIEIQINNYISI